MTQKRTLKEIALELLHKYAVARLTANDGCFNPSQADKDLKAEIEHYRSEIESAS